MLKEFLLNWRTEGHNSTQVKYTLYSNKTFLAAMSTQLVMETQRMCKEMGCQVSLHQEREDSSPSICQL